MLRASSFRSRKHRRGKQAAALLQIAFEEEYPTRPFRTRRPAQPSASDRRVARCVTQLAHEPPVSGVEQRCFHLRGTTGETVPDHEQFSVDGCVNRHDLVASRVLIGVAAFARAAEFAVADQRRDFAIKHHRIAHETPRRRIERTHYDVRDGAHTLVPQYAWV